MSMAKLAREIIEVFGLRNWLVMDLTVFVR
jgi:hypothetical protein